MIVGVPKEIKEHEFRVAMVPSGVETLVKRGHVVLVEQGAGLGSGISDDEYVAAGALILHDRRILFADAELIVKVKEPQASEFELLRAGQVLFTYLHLAINRPLLETLLTAGVVAIAYETVDIDGHLPLLEPMSEIAGRMAIQKGAGCLEVPLGRGVLLSRVPGVAPAEVVIIGAGTVGTNAARFAASFGARVSLLDISLPRLRYLDETMPANVSLLMSNPATLRECVARADLLIGAVLSKGARAPIVVSEEMVATMKRGAVIVDVAVDQGGCVETTRPTTHANPTYTVHGVVHYGVTNMPGVVARTATFALTNATLPYVLELADKGYQLAADADPALRRGLNVVRGSITQEAVAAAFGLPYVPFPLSTSA